MLSKTAVRSLKYLNLGAKKPIFRKFRSLNTAADEKNVLEDHSLDLSSQILEPPAILDELDFQTTMKLTHDSLAHFGLDTYWPAGLVRMGLQQLHLATGLPWWECIAAGVLAGRLLLFPFTLKTMRTAGKMRDQKEPLAEMSNRMNEARKSGDQLTMQITQYEMMSFQKKHGIGMTGGIKNAIPQMLYFVSYFIAIKRMASAPLESMKEGGLFWFVDLTATDPTWILSACCSSTLFFALKTGLDMPMDSMGQTMKTILRYGFPAVVFFSTHYFPSAVLVYWTTSNCFTLLMALCLRNATIRHKLNLPPRQIVKKDKISIGDIINYDQDGNPIRKKKFIWAAKDKCVEIYEKFIKNRANVAPLDQDLRHSDHVSFRKAGQGPLIPTYSYNPKEKFKEAFELRNEDKKARFGQLGRLFGKIFGS